MKNLFAKLFKRTNKTNTVTEPKTYEPEFLNEYIVDIGTNSSTHVYARNSAEARQMILNDMKNDVPYYDSRYYTSKYPGKKEDYRVPLRGEVNVIYNGVSTRRNPAYQG